VQASSAAFATAIAGAAMMVTYTATIDLPQPGDYTRFGTYLDSASYGAATWADTEAAWEVITGLKSRAARWYAGSTFTWGATPQAMAAAGVRVVLDLTPAYNPISATDLAGIDSMLATAKASGADVVVSLWHEPFFGGLTAAQFQSVITYYGPTVRKYYPLYVCLSGNDTDPVNGYYPSASQIDGIAVDQYAPDTTWLTNAAAVADSYRLPLALWEFNAPSDFGMIDAGVASPISGITLAQATAWFAAVQKIFRDRTVAGKPNGDLLLFSQTGSSTGTKNFLGSSQSDLAGFENGIGTWTPGSNVTIARSTAQAHSYGASLAFTATAAATISAGHCTTANVTTQGLPVTPGQIVGHSAWFKPDPAAANRFVQSGVSFYTSGGVFISNSFASSVQEAAGAWKFSGGTATAPATAAFAKATPQINNAGNGEIHYMDDVQLGAFPSSGTVDHTAPIQFPWDYRIPLVAAMAGALGDAPATGYARAWQAVPADLTLAVESLTVDRQTVTDMPDGTRLITGYPSAEAQMTLSGLVSTTDASKTIAWLLNPNEPTSPMYRYDALGSLIVIKAGLALPGSATPEQFTIFTGYLDDYTVDTQAGTATLVALDPRTKLTGSPVVPSVFDDGSNPFPTLYSQFALDYMLRTRGILSWPARRTGCVLAAGMRGNAAAEVGALTAFTPGAGTTLPINFVHPTPQTFALGGTGWGMGATIGAATYTLGSAVPVASPLFIEFFQSTTPSAGGGVVTVSDPVSGAFIRVRNDATGWVTVSFSTDGTGPNTTDLTPSVPDAAGYVGVQASWVGTAISVTVRRGGTTTTASGTAGSRPAVTFTRGVVASNNFSSACYLEGVQVTTESGGSSSFNDTFTPTAVLGLSLNAITVNPDLTGADIWASIQQIAEAEAGVGGFDELGVFRFINRDTIRTAASVRTVTPTYSLKTLQQQTGNSFVRNHIQVPVTAVAVQPYSVVWAAPSAIYIGPSGTYSTIVTTDNPVVGLGTTCGVIPSGGLVSGSGYRAAKNPDATVAVSNLRMSVAQTGPTTIQVTVINPNGYGVYLISPTGAGFPAGSDGIPMLQVGGRFVLPAGTNADTTITTPGGVIADWQWPPAVEGGAVTNPRGELLLAPPSNPWIQSLTNAQVLAQALGEDLYQPKPLWRNVQIVADPRLQLVDRVTITDPVTSKINDDARIFGVHTILSETDWSMNLDLRSLSTPGGWLIGMTGRSEIGATTYI
jgi:hypothetical protein